MFARTQYLPISSRLLLVDPPDLGACIAMSGQSLTAPNMPTVIANPQTFENMLRIFDEFEMLGGRSGEGEVKVMDRGRGKLSGW